MWLGVNLLRVGLFENVRLCPRVPTLAFERHLTLELEKPLPLNSKASCRCLTSLDTRA